MSTARGAAMTKAGTTRVATSPCSKRSRRPSRKADDAASLWARPQENDTVAIVQGHRGHRAAVIDCRILCSGDVLEAGVARGAHESRYGHGLRAVAFRVPENHAVL